MSDSSSDSLNSKDRLTRYLLTLRDLLLSATLSQDAKILLLE